jgi:hypothetical protein
MYGLGKAIAVLWSMDFLEKLTVTGSSQTSLALIELGVGGVFITFFF